MSKLSVITTVYNGEPYFERAIPSILNQTYSEYEWIIVDDGSTDKTLELLNQLSAQDQRVKIFSPGKLGRAKALNYAIENSSGEYIAQQDFDDISHSNRLKLQLDFLDNNPEVGVIGGYYIVSNEKRNEKFIRKPSPEHKHLITAMAKGVPFAHTIAMFRKQALFDAGGYPDAKTNVDLELWLNIAQTQWKFSSVSEILGEHFVYQESYWASQFKYGWRQRDLARLQLSIIKQLNLPTWMYIYPIGRWFYAFLPPISKRLIRRNLAGSKEQDL